MAGHPCGPGSLSLWIAKASKLNATATATKIPIGSVRFIRERAYSLRNALGLALGGIPGVYIAAKIIQRMPLYAVRWLVIVVVVYTAVTMLLSARAGEEKGQSSTEPAKA